VYITIIHNAEKCGITEEPCVWFTCEQPNSCREAKCCSK